jgi:hypothetical protein
MGRAIGAVVVGYLAMAVAVFALLTLLWMVLGPSGAFEPGSFRTSSTWSFASLALGFVAAVAGGWVCARIARTAMPPKVLAGLVLVLGILFAIPTLTTTPSAEARADDLPMFTAMSKAVTPPWVAFLNAVVGAAGVMVGARRRARPAK